MKKILGIIVLSCVLVSCSYHGKNADIDKDMLNHKSDIMKPCSSSEPDDGVFKGSIATDDAIITFETTDPRGGEKERRFIYQNTSGAVIEVGKNLEFLNGVEDMKGEISIIHVHKSVFGVDFLNRLQGLKGKLMIGINTDNKEKLILTKEMADAYHALDFESIIMTLVQGNDIGTIECGEGVTNIKEICDETGKEIG